MSWLLVAPILVPMLTALGACLLPLSERGRGRFGVVGAGVLTAVGGALLAQVISHGPQAVQMGDWPAPFGITLVVDLLGASMVLITGITGLAVAVYALHDIDAAMVRNGFHGFFHLLLAGVCGAFVTGDLFNLYVWFEVMLIASFALLVLGGTPAQIDGAVKYVVLNLISTVLLLTAIGLLYGLTGTLNMADLHLRLPTVDQPALVGAIAVTFLVAFGIKAALFPLFFWLPAAYHTPPVAISAIFAGLLTKVGVYALIRTFTLIFTGDVFPEEPILAVAMLTMLSGVLGAAAQSDFRRILSFHIVSQIGYMVLGLALATPLALAGAVFYVLHHIVVKANLFLVSGVAARLGGSFELKRLGGLYRSRPVLAVLFLIPALSLAGIPPLSGFWAKLLLIRASLDAEAYLIVAITLLTGLLTVYSMTKIWSEAFWKAPPAAGADRASSAGVPLTLLLPIAGLATLTVLVGLMPGPLLHLAEIAATQLLEPGAYVAVVLDARGGG